MDNHLFQKHLMTWGKISQYNESEKRHGIYRECIEYMWKVFPQTVNDF